MDFWDRYVAFPFYILVLVLLAMITEFYYLPYICRRSWKKFLKRITERVQ